jgi:hypothetical protein
MIAECVKRHPPHFGILSRGIISPDECLGLGSLGLIQSSLASDGSASRSFCTPSG